MPERMFVIVIIPCLGALINCQAFCDSTSWALQVTSDFMWEKDGFLKSQSVLAAM